MSSPVPPIFFISTFDSHLPFFFAGRLSHVRHCPAYVPQLHVHIIVEYTPKLIVKRREKQETRLNNWPYWVVYSENRTHQIKVKSQLS